MKPQSAAAPCARSGAKKNIKPFRGVGSALTGRLQTALLRSAPPGLAPHRYVPVAAAPGTPAARRRFPLHGGIHTSRTDRRTPPYLLFQQKEIKEASLCAETTG